MLAPHVRFDPNGERFVNDLANQANALSRPDWPSQAIGSGSLGAPLSVSLANMAVSCKLSPTNSAWVPDEFHYTIGAVVEQQPLINSMGVALANN